MQNGLEYEFGGICDVDYCIQNAVTKKELSVRAKGKPWFGNDKILIDLIEHRRLLPKEIAGNY